MTNDLKYALDNILSFSRQHGFLFKKMEGPHQIFISFMSEIPAKRTAASLENDLVAAALIEKVNKVVSRKPYSCAMNFTSRADETIFLSVSDIASTIDDGVPLSHVYIEIVID